MTGDPASGMNTRTAILDTIAAALSLSRRDQLALLLRDEDIEMLRDLVDRGMGDNTLRALTSDLAYLQAWSQAATGAPLPWPAPETLILTFIAQHLWDPQRREQDLAHGMPEGVMANLAHAGLLRRDGPHTPGTVRRRLATWATLSKWRGLETAFASPAIKSVLRTASDARKNERAGKGGKAITADILERMLATCDGDSLRDVRDRAILLLGFAAGGRRRSEIAGLRFEQLQTLPSIEREDGPPLPALAINLGISRKATRKDRIHLSGRPVEAIHAWLSVAGIEAGHVFRAIDRWGNVGRRVLDPKSVTDIVKQRAALAGFDRKEFSAHGLRSGYLSDAAARGMSLTEAMEQSRHRSIQQARQYYTTDTRLPD